ncbi:MULTISPECIES: tyrosine-type recombinase/integrase [Erythrobacteraceae]|uniref:Tyrosine-type recombinase/integrase n=1 Tax=Qipengyuania aquimaris TaxID=255984 RepID=A0A9Q3RYW6_9SPHN|nr:MULTISPECIES: site-specific integrase [Erythrobacteraceae]MBY6129434.1 tyrosine-type recombinase/integrase [Qipengyuania aquimaris]MBY6217024.1 tyrosine-type recombinase/integrase [Qipengyuania aquimaris]MCA0902948.1 tyrosine-type recombinase/integrase [Qipengyuania aquimaris]UOR16701.1 tyrosine-type recombinase/integrase [Qipengyuania aquimaris]
MGKLTALQIRNLKEPGRYGDGDGLALVLTAQNKGYWVLRSTIKGRRRDIGLGSLSLVNLKEARENAFEMRRDIQRGIDPIAERKRQEVVVPTFANAARTVHEEQKAGWKNGKHQTQWITTLEKYAFPKLGDRLVDDIEGPVIRECLLPIWLDKPETARRVKQRIGVVLDWAYANGMRETEAPMRSLGRALPRQPKQDSHFAAMPYKDIPAFLEHLHKRTTVARLALEFLILCASRSGEVRGAKWAEIDLKNRLWTIPAERMKVGKEHVVPLTDAAIDVLQRARPFYAECSDMIFPGRNVLRPMSDMTLLKILRYAKLPFTVHGFRSSFRDWAAEQTSYPGEVAEAALAHTVANKVEAAYRRTNYLDKRRDLMRDWAAFCTSNGRLN